MNFKVYSIALVFGLISTMVMPVTSSLGLNTSGFNTRRRKHARNKITLLLYTICPTMGEI